MLWITKRKALYKCVLLLLLLLLLGNTFPVFLMCSLFFTFRTVDILNQRKQVEVR